MADLAKAPERRGAPLFARILALALAVSVVPIVALGALLIDRNAQALRTATRELHLAIASDARRAVRAELVRVREELTGMGQLMLAPGLGDDAQRLALVGAKITASGTFDSVSIFLPDGRRGPTLKAREALSVESPPAPPVTLLAQAAPGKLLIGEARAKNGLPVLPVYLGIGAAGELKGLLGTVLPLEALCKLAAQLGEERLGARDALRVVDGDERLVIAGDVARAAARELMAGRSVFSSIGGRPSFRNEFGTATDFTEGETPMLGAIETIPELGWAVVTRQPRALAYLSLEKMRRDVALAVLAAVIAAVLGGAFLARRLVVPIRALAKATREIAARRYQPAPAEVSSRGDELGDLGRAFDVMAKDLASSEEKLLTETKARSSLSRYLSADVVELILKHPDKLRLGGEKRDVTILFADVCGFTRLSESNPPETIVAILNEIFTFATEIVERRGGIIDKFIGDCVMAVWGTPESRPDDPLRAVLAAEDLRRWLDTANRKFRSKYGLEIRLAMGVNTGLAVAGNIGSDKRMEYTVIGDAVNVAARLEAMAQPGQILVSESTRARVGEELALRSLGESALQGRKQTTSVYEVPE